MWAMPSAKARCLKAPESRLTVLTVSSSDVTHNTNNAMKTILSRLNKFCFTTRKRQILFGLCLSLGTLALLGSVTRNHQKKFVAHEWGTFTSVQGSDGRLLDWRPLQTSQLPHFVYDWQNAGFN